MFSKFQGLTLNFALVLLMVQCFISSCVSAVPVEGEAAKEVDTNDVGSGEAAKEFDINDVDSVCGRQLYEEPNGRIISGTESTFGNWPWVVSLMKQDSKTKVWEHQCGATLLNHWWVLTAVHCLFTSEHQYNAPSDLLLRFGDFNINAENEPKRHVDRTVELIKRHDNFNSDSYENDYALLKLGSELPFQTHVLPICLTEGNSDYDGVTATAVGWGMMSHSGEYPDKLLEAQLTVMNNTECRKRYINAGYRIEFYNVFLCAGGSYDNVLDTCLGDSGGPLMVQRNTDRRYEIIGISSWGRDCGTPGLPGVYARVTEAKKWITDTIAKNSEAA